MDAVASSAIVLDRLDLQPSMRVLDVGCGPGRLTIPAAERVGSQGKVVAIDIQTAMLHQLEKRVTESGLSSVRTVVIDIGQGKLELDAYDRALLVTVLGEIPDREHALREIYTTLKPEGILSVTEVILDPHYQSQNTVRHLAEGIGFRLEQTYGNVLAFTMNFVKPENSSSR